MHPHAPPSSVTDGPGDGHLPPSACLTLEAGSASSNVPGSGPGRADHVEKRGEQDDPHENRDAVD